MIHPNPFDRWPVWARVLLLLVFVLSFFCDQQPSGEQQQAILLELAILAVSLVLTSLLNKPKLEDARPAGLGDFDVPTATEARVVPLVWGRVKMSGPNVVWYGDLLQFPIKEKVKTGLFSSSRVVVGFKYHVGVQFAICRGPGVALRRIWIGDRQVWSGTADTDGDTIDIDDPNFFGGKKRGGGLSTTVELYTGSTTQSVSTYLGLHQDSGAGSDRTPRYTGTCYAVARGLNSTSTGAYIGDSASMRPWSFEVERFSPTWSGQTADHKIANKASNPANAIYEILTNTEWGYGFPAADIDAGGAGTSFDDAATTLETEGNGFAMALTSPKTASELLEEIQRQIDGVVFLDHQTGKWTLKLARADYNIDLVPQLTDSTVAEVRSFTRGSYSDTTNQVQVQYWRREVDDDGGVHYKETFAVAQDVGNALIQGGGTVSSAQLVPSQTSYPGCKESALANQLAWRDLRAKACPLARAALVVSREYWDVRLNDVVAWTSPTLGFTKLPMRVVEIDYGILTDNKITLTCVQDVFQYAAGSFSDPGDSRWNPPSGTLSAFPTDESVAFEAPRAVVVRDPEYGGDPYVGKIMTGARRQSSEVGYWITERHSSGATSGDYADSGQSFGFFYIGELNADLSAGESNPVSTISVDPDPDTKADLLLNFDVLTESDLGVDLAQLIMVGDEFMLARYANDGGATVDMYDVWRGALDSVQGNHSAGDPVYMLFVSGCVSEGNFDPTHNVDVRLDGFNSRARYSDTGTPNTISFTMAKRAQRPYPPAAVLYNGTSTEFGTPDMEGDGAGENGYGCDVDWYRRRYNPGDEVFALQSDDTSVDASHETRMRVFVDPDGVNTEIASSPTAWATGSGTPRINRNELIEIAPAGTKIRVQLETRHDSPLDATVLTSRDDFIHDVVPSSDNDGLVYLGGDLGPLTASSVYTVTQAGVHTIRIGAAYATSNVDVRVNGGGWSATIGAGGTSGTTSPLGIGDTIEVRHTASEGPDPQFVEIENPSASRVAYGTFSA